MKSPRAADRKADTDVFELAELLSNITPDVIHALEALSVGVRSALGVSQDLGIASKEADELLFEMACLGLVRKAPGKRRSKLSEKGKKVWRALEDLLRA